MFTMRPVGFVRGPHTDTSQIPKGCGAKHEAEDASKPFDESKVKGGASYSLEGSGAVILN